MNSLFELMTPREHLQVCGGGKGGRRSSAWLREALLGHPTPAHWLLQLFARLRGVPASRITAVVEEKIHQLDLLQVRSRHLPPSLPSSGCLPAASG